MKDTAVEVSEKYVSKRSITIRGYKRVGYELRILKGLEDSAHTPNVLHSSDENGAASIHMQKIIGKSAKQLIGMRDGYMAKPIAWDTAKGWLSQYIEAEMDLLRKGYLYRDLNLEHIIFHNGKVSFIDLESTILHTHPGVWNLQDARGTWETMAPEEFPGHNKLSERTATYRTAVVAHLFLTGRLPFKRFPDSRSATHHWRKSHVAIIDQSLSKSTQHVFKVALARKQIHRHKNPDSFFNRLVESYEHN